ncbi:uncharacterized protein [Anabrus simplex]|uniref:uncharacterized protein n=1 Tax=Anabrus simplex TaxID=316456 RepID=UPI0035A38597
MHAKCQICGICADSEEVQQQGILFHRFLVARLDICRKWLDVVGVERLRQLPSTQLKSRFVCSRHFRRSSYPGPLSRVPYQDAVPERSASPATPTAAPTTCTTTTTTTASTTTFTPAATISTGTAATTDD